MEALQNLVPSENLAPPAPLRIQPSPDSNGSPQPLKSSPQNHTFCLASSPFPRGRVHSMCNQASDLRQQLELASELESDLQDTVDCGVGNGLLISMLENSTGSFDQSNNPGAIDVKMDGSNLEEKSYFKILRLTFSSKLN